MSQGKKPKSSSVTGDQKQAIIDFMNLHPNLAKGNFSASFTNQKATDLWQDLTNLLNSIPGPIKDWKTWRRTWHDMKGNAKAKKAKVNANLRKTGGGESTVTPLNNMEESLVGIIGEVPITGDPHSSESSVTFDFQKPSSSKTLSPLITLPLSAPLVDEFTNIQNVSQIKLFDVSTSGERSVNSSTLPEQETQINDTKSISADQRHNDDNENTPVIKKTNNKFKNKMCHLENSVKATTDLGMLSKERNNMLENYYAKN